MPLLISDANVLIDLEVGELLERMFALPHEITTPDALYADELEEHHPHLLQLGLQLRELDGDVINAAAQLRQQYRRVSGYDCLALALAVRLECPLLTGDAALREVARQESVEVMGTLWLVEEMIRHRLIDTRQARDAFDRMRRNGRRLPWQKADTLIRRYP
ncbi:DUF3368 domain-containing protein [Aquisalimonas asiatica]|uniref:PIN domain-containing protein n=1 Tax=Aquisalimonas asiatica TaxID=406100 RepID=A0A1H8T0U0_9GAMM|nr:DUF3368 domain-containing protein [Aquisalimonas asiatica]SEO84204.1 protein of unknown function [Aquisalimonas asiatica]